MADAFEKPRSMAGTAMEKLNGSRFLLPKLTPRRLKSSWESVKNEKSEIVDFVYPFVAKSTFLNPKGRQDEPSMTPGNDFQSDRKR